MLAPLHARITRIVIDEKISPAFCKGAACASYGDAGQYEQIAGRAFGELDPDDPRNKIIQDIELGKDTDGKVRYVATFVITKPIDMTKASGLLWHDVPNRGRPLTISAQERGFGDVGLASAWQGDNAGMSAGLGTTVRPTMNVGGNHWLQVPVAKNPDGSPITGPVLGRIVNRSGPGAQPLIVQTNPLPYMPASLDTSKATLVSRDHESMEGVVTGETPIAAADWKFCGGGTFDAPVPLTTLPVQICLKGGFNPAKLYQVVYTAKDPYILGIGFAAWRDVASFFKYADKDDAGTANPLAGRIKHSITRGRSQSGNYLRGWLHLGFNQDEAKRQVHDGMWPIIAGRRIALNFRWAQPDGVLELYQAGSEGPQWWVPYARRDARPAGAQRPRPLQRDQDVPENHRAFRRRGDLGTEARPRMGRHECEGRHPAARQRAPLLHREHHARRRRRRLRHEPARSALAAKPVECPGNNSGFGVLPANPMPHTETVSALTVHFRDWVMRNTPPPAEPLSDAARAPTRRSRPRPRWASRRFRACAPTAPEPGFINPVLDYDWGPSFDPNDASGVPSNAVPPIKQVIRIAGAESQRRRQRNRRRAGRAARGAARHLPRLEHHRRWRTAVSQGQAVRERRQHDPVRKNESRAHGQQRSAAVTGRALYRPRGLRRGGQKSRGQRGRAEVPAAEGCRCADRRGGCE